VDLEELEVTEECIPDILSIVEMTPEEAMSSLSSSPHHNSPPIKTIRTKHHQLAKLLACGFKDADIARKVGYSTGTVNTLKSNPAIKELVEHYSGEYQESVSELHDRMEAMTIDLLDELQARLEDDGSRTDISVSELKDLLKDFLDRIGHGPIKRIEQHTVNENRYAGIIKHVREVAAEKRFDSGGARLVGEGPIRRALPEGRGFGMGQAPLREPLAERAEGERRRAAGAEV